MVTCILTTPGDKNTTQLCGDYFRNHGNKKSVFKQPGFHGKSPAGFFFSLLKLGPSKLQKTIMYLKDSVPGNEATEATVPSFTRWNYYSFPGVRNGLALIARPRWEVNWSHASDHQDFFLGWIFLSRESL